VTVTAKALKPDGTSVAAGAPANIIIGGTAGSISIGRATEVIPSTDETYYELPVSVIVADSNGAPMANTTVNLSTWPAAFSTGTICLWHATFQAEDMNENLIRDPGEDDKTAIVRLDNLSFNPMTNPLAPIPFRVKRGPDWFIEFYTPTSMYNIPNGVLTPANSAAGTVPNTVVTDKNGVASFKYTYLKGDALWTVARLRASTFVQGTETRAELKFRLPASVIDLGGENKDPDKCRLPPSPYNSIVETQGVQPVARKLK
jgi:hypothetical protein